MNVIVIVGMTFIVAAAFTRYFCNPHSAGYMLDHPNERSLHDRPMPRGGGLAIAAAIFTGGGLITWFHPQFKLAVMALAVLVVATVSFFDDRYSVPPFYRFLAHFFSATAIIFYGGFFLEKFEIAHIIFSWPRTTGMVLSLLFVIWMINLYNFMDGMDGFAAGMALFGFGSFAALGWMAGNELFLMINLVIAAAAAGFLVFNFPPARIFMGDVGSSTLGLLAAILSIWGAQDGIFPFWIALLVFSPFIVDATFTLFRRMLRREKIWQAHKSHYYQRLVQAGWGHRKTVLLEYAYMLGCGITALWAVRASVGWQWASLAMWVSLYFLLFFRISRLTRPRLS